MCRAETIPHAQNLESIMAKSNKAAARKSNSGARARAQTRARAVPPTQDAGGDLPPRDMDEFRLALARKIMAMLGLPRRCREPACRRGRRCAGRDLRCQRDFPGPPMTQDEQARALAELQRALKRRVELEA
jgi:hypothetical protein